MLTPMLRALEQLDDPIFLGVLLRSLALSVLAFVALVFGSFWAVQTLLNQPGWLGWAAGVFGSLAAIMLAFVSFVPVALLIATLYLDRVSAAVERRFYPFLPKPEGAHVAVQAWDGVALGAKVLAWQAVALVAALVLPGPGLIIGWALTAWAIGRGLFVAVAMRRMSRLAAIELYRRRRVAVLVQGGILALASTIPLLNLLVPVLGVAALTHVMDTGLAAPERKALA